MWPRWIKWFLWCLLPYFRRTLKDYIYKKPMLNRSPFPLCEEGMLSQASRGGRRIRESGSWKFQILAVNDIHDISFNWTFEEVTLSTSSILVLRLGLFFHRVQRAVSHVPCYHTGSVKCFQVSIWTRVRCVDAPCLHSRRAVQTHTRLQLRSHLLN